jgi:hypothetical protein
MIRCSSADRPAKASLPFEEADEVFAMPRPPRQPTLLRIPAHHTPHANDPPDAHEFYAALGMFTVAWGRFEGHIIGALLKILAMPEASAISSPIPILWEKWPKRAELWEAAFKTIPSLAPCKDLAIAFMNRVMEEIKDRHFGAHAIWDEFIQAATRRLRHLQIPTTPATAPLLI